MVFSCFAVIGGQESQGPGHLREQALVPSYYLITQPFSEERAHETRRRVTPSHVSVFLLGYPPESAPDRHNPVVDLYPLVHR